MRRMPMICLMAALGATGLGAGAGALGAEDTPEQVQVDVHVAAEWVRLPMPEGDKAPGRAVALSAVRILRAVDPATKEPYDASNDQVGCDPMALRREFRLEKAEFVLGEPILVELRVALANYGEWQEPVGGNYRARGRDDNFLFLMRHEDGTWVGDPYAPVMWYMGGMMTTHAVTERQSLSYWLPVQRWCAVERPGKYELYCFHCAHDWHVIGQRAALLAGLPEEIMKDHVLDADGVLVDAATRERSTRYGLSTRHVPVGEGGQWAKTALWSELPLAVTAHAKEANGWSAEQTSDFAHFKIVIREGTPEERRAMIERWSSNAAGPYDDRWGYGTPRAARQAIQFAMQDDFLPVIADWIKLDQETDYYNLSGLAMRPSRASTELLLKAGAKDAVGGLYYLRKEKMADVIPSLIEWLADEDAEVRRLAEWYLRKWTGESFGHTWEEEEREHPTLEEGKAMQPAWRAWWAEHAAGFKPKE